MKTLVYVLSFLVLFSAAGQSEMFRKTASDIYHESYQAQMKRLSEMSAAEIRADEYLRVYEKCDAHHNCAAPADACKEERDSAQLEFFTYVPVWQ